MTVNAPETSELVQQLVALFDAAAETRTEDRHPAPEVVVELARQHYPIFDIDPEVFVDNAFDLWERLRVTEATIGRFDPDADAGLAPERTARAIEQVREHALADLTWMVSRHLGQPQPQLAHTAVGIAVTAHKVSASAELDFPEGDGPVVTARQGGVLHGCRFRLSQLAITVSALTQDDGSVHVHTSLRPTAGALVYDPAGDDSWLNHGDWRLLTLHEDQLPEVARHAHAQLVRAVHTFHPALALADAPTA